MGIYLSKLFAGHSILWRNSGRAQCPADHAAEAVAQFTGGEFFHFHEEKDLKAGLIAVSNDVPNYYLLSFRPTSLTPGLHALHLEVKDGPRADVSHLLIKSRSGYWMDSDTAH